MAGLKWQPGLDGLRAVALTAVVADHVAPGSAPGSFVSLSVFFTLSGYLITALLLHEAEQTGQISLKRFWSRRARRLWPMAWFTLAGIGVLTLLGSFGPDLRSTIFGDILAGFGQVTNWWQLAHDGYLNAFGRPNPLHHLWSLAIEEQFYLVWPLLVFAVRGKRRSVGIVVGVGIVASIGAALLASTPDRVYLGTDVRMGEILVGAALAVVWSKHPLRGPRQALARRAVLVWGAVGVIPIIIGVFYFNATDPFWGYGGFVLLSTASLGVVAAAVTNGPFKWILSAPPLVWVGQRSYAIYLFHWPIWLAMPIGWSSSVRIVLTLGLTFGGAALTHVAIERPVRDKRVPRKPLVAAALSVVTIMLGSSLAAARTGGPAPVELVQETLSTVADPTTIAPGSTTTTIACPEPVGPPTTTKGQSVLKGSLNEGVDPAVTQCGKAVSVLILGDSTARGLANGLKALGRTDLLVWDRSVLRCSMGGGACPDWRVIWPQAVQEVKPDVVVLNMIPEKQLRDAGSTKFASAAEQQRRIDEITAAMTIAGSTGATVLWSKGPDLLLPQSLFYCDLKRKGSVCDPAWMALWNEAAAAGASTTGTKLVDVAGWAAPRTTASQDRPDGVHYTGSGLADLATWFAPQIVRAGRE